MSVVVTFQPVGISGLVAEGTRLIDAGKRMGVRVAADCKGPGECSSCVVLVLTGLNLLSVPTEHETRTLGAERLAQNQRLACQATIEKDGEVVIELIPESMKDEAKDIRKTFAQLPFNRKLITLVQLETITASEARDELVARVTAAREKVVNLLRRESKTLVARKPTQKREDK